MSESPVGDGERSEDEEARDSLAGDFLERLDPDLSEFDEESNNSGGEPDRR